MTLTMEYTGTLTVHNCGECGIQFAMPETLYLARRADHKTFYCPQGHPRVFVSESDLEREKRQRISAQARLARTEDELGMERRSLAAHKGWNTRLRNRIANGVCPCCNRSFSNVLRHMAGQHPEFAIPKEN